jgi:membrane-bound serine protease (ClpP class)
MLVAILLAIVVALASWAAPLNAQAARDPVLISELRGVINALSARYLDRALEEAEEQNAQLFLLYLDTPGGLDTAMREMVQSLLDTPVPTVVYVAPDGARATSAGLFVAMAADVIAMAPATHIGAAHPVSMGSELDEVSTEKVTNEAVSLVRTLAETQGRNADWAERAIRDNLAVSANEALELDVIDLVAVDLEALLAELDGQTVGDRGLEPVGAPRVRESMNVAERFLHLISDPNIAFVLLSLGSILALVELADPGLTVAGIAAATCFLFAFMALGSLPVNWAGILLLMVAVVLFVVGLLTDTEIIVSLAALVPFVLGALILFSPFTPTSPAAPDVQVSPWLIAAMGALLLGFTLLVLRAITSALQQPARAGAPRLIGQEGLALTHINPHGQVRVGLEEWSAVSAGPPIPAGTPIHVVGISGVRLKVVPQEHRIGLTNRKGDRL